MPGLITKGKWHRRSLFWIFLAIMLLILDRTLPDTVWYSAYTLGFYPGIRLLYDVLWSWSPLPLIYVLLGVILYRAWRWRTDFAKGLLFALSRAIGGIAFLMATFYITWAFNYHQPSLQEKHDWSETIMTEEDVHHEFIRATEILRMDALNLFPSDTTAQALRSKRIRDADVRHEVRKALQMLDLSNKGNVRVRKLWPAGSLLHWSTAGIYIAQTGEGHVDPGLLSVQDPFTMSHEMAHGFGVTDEGDCNFIAWLACSLSDDPFVRYSGSLIYWRYVAVEMDRTSRQAALDSLPSVVHHSLDLIYLNDQRFPDWMPSVRDAVYSNYLKRHGVKQGLRSYNQVVRLVHAYRKSHESVHPGRVE